jgi:hypothetical protein
MKVLLLCLLMINLLDAQTIRMSPASFEAVNVRIEESVHRSRPALRVTETGDNKESIALLKGIRFTDGTIEAEIAGKVRPDADSTARGFIGIAFRVKTGDTVRYDCFYLRPTNGRSDDQLRRNRTTQYIAHPGFPWYTLRKDFPSKYESYADIDEGEWTNVRITVEGDHARLYINGAKQPALIVKELLNTESSGAVALWIGQGTEGFFRGLTVTRK